MNQDKEEKKEEKTKSVPLTLITILIVIIIGGFIFWEVSNSFSCYECDRLKEELNKKTNVSEEYRQGWIDCIEKLRDIRQEATNITSQFDLIKNPYI